MYYYNIKYLSRTSVFLIKNILIFDKNFLFFCNKMPPAFVIYMKTKIGRLQQMNINLLTDAFTDCINSFNFNYFLENISEDIQIMLLSKENKLLKIFQKDSEGLSSVNISSIDNADCKEIIKLVKLRNMSVKKTFPCSKDSIDKTIASSAIRKDSGEIIGYIVVRNGNINNEFMLFLEALSKQVFYCYQLLLLNFHFEKHKKENTLSFTEDFTKKELEILELICKGKKDKEISQTLLISISTVRKHIYNIFIKTGTCSRSLLCSLYYNYLFSKIID